MNFFVENLRNPSLYTKEQSTRRKFEIKSCLLFLKILKNGQHSFWSVQGKTKLFLGFSSVFAFKQAKEQILFQVQPLKMFFF